jgi:hypothetical protein
MALPGACWACGSWLLAVAAWLVLGLLLWLLLR